MVRRAVLLAVIVAMAASVDARAGTYQVRACAGGGNASWAPFSSSGAAFDIQPGCPFTAITASSASAQAGFFEAAWWRFTAPPGTVVDRLRIARYGYRFLDQPDNPQGGVNQGGWISEAYTEDGAVSAGFAREGCTIAAGQYLCDWGSRDPNAAVEFDLDAQQVTYQVACIRGTGCRSGSDMAFPLAAVTIHNAVVTIRDDVAPTLSVAGPLLAGGWRRPDEELVLDASDVTGISAVSASPGGSLATTCDYTRPAPCTNVAGGRLRLSGLADGPQSVQVTVNDAAGNPATSTHQVNVDGTPPSALLRAPSGRTLVVEVADEHSGVASGQILVGGAPLPTTLARGHLTARLPSGSPRRADIRVSVTDAAGNTATGIPPRLDVPERVRPRHGRRVAIRGRLTTPTGAPLAGVTIQATAAIRRRGATAQPAGSATTNGRGRFTLRLPAGPSRTVRLVVPPAGEHLRAARGVSVRVPASSTIRASRRVVGPGTRATFSGTIRRAGQPLPRRGLVVVLQGRTGGRWFTFADTRTSRTGRWRASYVFRGVPGRYPIRLRIRRANGFPFELGHSPTTTVRVR